MTDHESTDDARVGPALRRVLTRPGGAELLDVLVTELSGADLTTLLLEVFRRRADRLTPAEVMRRYRSDRFVAPAPTDPAVLRRTEDVLLAALPDGFETLVLAPLLPLGAHCAVASVDPRKVVATIRGSEVAADPTNALALEAAERRARAMATDSRSAVPVRLAATQRVVRAQHFGAPGMLAHFQLFAMVSAGRDTGNRAFEHQHLTEHLQFATRALSRAGIEHAEIRLTSLDESSIPLREHARAALAATPGIDVLDDPERTTGRGYYTHLCYKVYATIAGQCVEIADGGFVDWTQQLTGSRKERLLISGFGVDRLAGA
ncbi:hypothetical protein KGA66_22375 [Actinocrinis puniceicyclus]|uniref:Uncharacterized protein n=1 Tax=Actinocrinis puniceicyclus TaxID=977794 RepID=A0A8J7WNU3_9ACTN|nr:hypothetical protein [Actinocrinis puniceicyclus]MBS2965816.1 hypothetical protein [Actinocrinis puniceicyclus]